MKKILTKIFSVALVFVMIMCLVPPVDAQASSKKPTLAKTREMTYYPKTSVYWNQSYLELLQNNKSVKGWTISRIKSSNTKVLTVKKSSVKNSSGVEITAKKAGKAVVSFRAKKGKNTYSYKCTVTVRKYTNPIKTLKLGNKNYRSQFANYDYFNLNSKKTVKGKLTVSAAKGWKLKEIQLYNSKTQKAKTIKNKSTVSLKNKTNTLWLTFTNTKTKRNTVIFLTNYHY